MGDYSAAAPPARVTKMPDDLRARLTALVDELREAAGWNECDGQEAVAAALAAWADRFAACLREPPAAAPEAWTLTSYGPHGKAVVVLTPAEAESVVRWLDAARAAAPEES